MFETNFGTLDWGIVIVYLVIAGAIGVVVNRYIHNVAAYMVGGRAAGTALNTATYIGTGLGLVTIMYASIDGFSHGFSYMTLGIIGACVGLFLGSTGFVIRRLRAMKLVTIPEYFQRRFSRRVRITGGIICAVAGILNMGLFPKMGATFITYATGLGESHEVAVVEMVTAPDSALAADEATATDTAAPESGGMTDQAVMVNIVTSMLIVLVLLYTVLGGMVSVIVTDYIQFVVLSIGLGLGLYFCLTRPDLGWDNMVGALRTHRGEGAFNPTHPSSYGWMWVIWMAVHFLVASICWAPEASRALTSKDPDTAKRTFLVGAPGQFIRLAIPAMLAVAAFCFVSQDAQLTAHFFPDGLGGPAAHADQAMPLLLGKIVPSGMLGLLVAGLMAAFMSTHDSYFLCWSSVITRDVIGPLRRRELSDAQQIRITRVTIVVIGVFLLIWGIWYELPASVWEYMAVTGNIYMCGSIVALVGGIYWRGASSAGAMAALLGGLASMVLLFLPEQYKNDTTAKALFSLGNYLLCVILFVVFSLLMPNRTEAEEG